MMITLAEIAHRAMIEKGFIPDFPKRVLDELTAIHAPSKPQNEVRDLRHLLWVSIDNDDSFDLDQLTYAEKLRSGMSKIYVAVADVDGIVKKGSAVDNQAEHNTTSVYTPGKVFPMLPLKLSNDLTSLNENTDRCANVVELDISKDGDFELADVYPALVRNHGKLTYNGVGTCLETQICLLHPIPSIPGLRKQLEIQDEIAQRIENFRNRQGALHFAEIELQPIVINGVAVGLEERISNRAHKLIENYMIAANVGVTRYLNKKNYPTLRRVVKTPKRWGRIVELAKDLGDELPSKPDVKALRAFLLKQERASPLQFPDLSLAIIKLIGRGEYVLGHPKEKHLGHFDLAELEYAHTTAPNRRFPDVVMQRIVKSSFQGKPSPYTDNELAEIAAHCTQKEDDATKVERRMVKCAAAMVLLKQIGHVFKAMVTGAGAKGTWVRLLDPPIEGKLVRGFENADVGDYLKVKLVHVDVVNGHIDFNRM